MEQIVITHGFVKKLAANIRSKYGREARHTEVLELVADALGFKAGPLMHALKTQAEAGMPKSDAASSASLDGAGRPTALAMIEVDVGMEQIHLPEDQINILHRFLEEQSRSRDYLDAGLGPRNKALIFGSQTTDVAKAIAKSIGCPLYEVRYHALISQEPGETAKRLRAVFDYAENQRCVLFFDDIDVIGGERDDPHSSDEMKRLVSTLLVHLDDVPPNVVVVGATGYPKMLDRAFLRRFHIRLGENPLRPDNAWVLVSDSEGLTEFQRRHVALAEKAAGGERVLFVVEDYDKHPDVSAARQYLRRKGCNWSRVEFSSRGDVAAMYHDAAHSRNLPD
jgi:predicted AAA+ superfamily ATPase